MEFKDYPKYVMKHVWLKLPYHKPIKALVVGIEFENERINLKYQNKYKEEIIRFHWPDDIITPDQYKQLHLPELWDKTKENVEKKSSDD